ncbi:MAG TPA: GtrA family protein [Polyangia bacterium]|nr:GtrA family protein [Polyangia bacterium]
MAQAAPERPVGFWQWMRHHLASVLATAVDYLVMVLGVEVLRLTPVAATPLGALAGAVANFTLGRRFTYQTTEVPVPRQAWRYAIVSAASLGLNTAGEYFFHDRLHIEYLLARVITSVIVSNAWNYPMQRYFVFPAPRPKMTGAA